MKVLDLACAFGHSFEGWFGSEDDFQSQLARGLVQCPICDDAKITKKLSAPRLNLSGAKEAAPADAHQDTHSKEVTPNSVALHADSMPATGQNDTQSIAKTAHAEHPLHTLMQNPEFQAAYMQMAKDVLAKTEDVGNDFAREARKIHYGTSKERGKRGIRGQASHDETMELLDEGIDVMPLPLPKALKGTLQ
jgi:hypothetical protein